MLTFWFFNTKGSAVIPLQVHLQKEMAFQAFTLPSASNEEDEDDPIKNPRVALQCFNCSGLLFGKICMKDHFKVCREKPRTYEHWSPQNFRPIARHDKNPSLLCKWLACPNCSLQHMLARSPERSFLSLRLKLLCWARLVFLLTAKHKVKAVWAQTCKRPPLFKEALGLVVDFLA